MYIMLPKDLNRSKSNANRVIGLNINSGTEIMLPINRSKKPKRFRSAFSTEQLSSLEKEFKKFPYISSVNRKEVANKLNISERAVKIWFQNRRMREKNENCKSDFNVFLSNNNINLPNEKLNNVRDLRPHNYEPECTNKSPQLCKNNNLNMDIEQNISKQKNSIQANQQNQNTVTLNNVIKTSEASSKNEICYDQNNCNYAKQVHTRVIIEDEPTPVAPASQRNAIPHYENLEQGRKTNNKRHQQKFEMPQDLSSKSRSSQQKCLQNQQYISAVNPNQKYVPIYPHSYCSGLPSPASSSVTTRYPAPIVSSIPHGNVVWRPVNIMPQPTLTRIPMASGYPTYHHNIPKSGCDCNCNCHGTTQGVHQARGFSQDPRIQPQYIIAIPFSNNPCNKM